MDLEGDVEAELRHGHAIRIPEPDGSSGPLVEWSWQTLELLAAAWHLVVEDQRVYPVAHGMHDPEFISRPFHSMEELVTACEAYLKYRRLHQENLKRQISSH